MSFKAMGSMHSDPATSSTPHFPFHVGKAHPPQPRRPSPGSSVVFSLPPPRFCLSSPSPPLQPGQDPSPSELPTKEDRGVGQRIFKVTVAGHCEETPTSPTTSNAPFQLPSCVQLTGVRLTLILVQPAPQFIPACFLFHMELESLNTSPPFPPPASPWQPLSVPVNWPP